MNKIIQGDCIEEMKKLDSNSVDIIITSPPYEDVSGAGYSAKKKDVLFLKLYSEFLDKVFEQYHRILKDGGQVFFNVKSKTFNKKLRTPHWLEFTEGFNLLDFKSYIIWKYAGSFDSSNKRYHLDYEIIYHLAKGDITIVGDDTKDPLTSVWYLPHNIKNRVHPTQMPKRVAKKILDTTKPEGVVFDSFAGSGTTCVVAKEKGLDYIGIEINPEYIEIANKRLENIQGKLL